MKKVAVYAAVMCLALGMAGSFTFANSRTEDALGVAVSPQNLILSMEQSGTVTVHTAIKFTTVEASTLTLNGIPVSGVYADSRGNIVANFNEAAVKAIVTPPEAVLTLTGILKTGEAFTGSDTVRVTP